jgi:hypothetical protein
MTTTAIKAAIKPYSIAVAAPALITASCVALRL